MANYILGKGYLWQPVTGLQRGLFVRAGTVAQSATAMSAITQVAIGVNQETFTDAMAATGKFVAPIWIPGSIARVVANAPIAKDAKVAPAANGKAQTAVSTQFPAGIALTAAAALNDEIDVLLFAGAVVV